MDLLAAPAAARSRPQAAAVSAEQQAASEAADDGLVVAMARLR